MPPICDPDIQRYAEQHTTRQPDYLVELAQQTERELSTPQMLTGPVEGRFLEMLVFTSGARRILEIGTYSGYSALAMAQALPDDGRVVTCEINSTHAAFARRHIQASPHAHKIEILEGPAKESIAKLGGPFDLVFVDADKTGYRDYYEAALPLLGARGLMALDNTLWSGAVLDQSDDSENTRSVRSLNDYIASDPRVICVQLTVRDGITLVRKNAEH
jgi:caffeoyl-CoA O-methyltransferase